MNEEQRSIALAVEDGSYFKQARDWYSEIVHMPIAERSYYIIIIFLCVINTYFAIQSFTGVFPISPMVPFTVYSDNIWDDLPRINRIAENKLEDKNVAVMKFLLRTYVENRESYDLKLYEFRYRNIWNHSSKGVFERYKELMDASNPYGPYRLYANKERRIITIRSLDYERGEEESFARIRFYASVVSLTTGKVVSQSSQEALIRYKYTDFSVDQSLDQSVWAARFFGLTGGGLRDSGERRKVVPMTFLVLDYQVKELLE